MLRFLELYAGNKVGARQRVRDESVSQCATHAVGQELKNRPVMDGAPYSVESTITGDDCMSSCLEKSSLKRLLGQAFSWNQ